MLKKKKRITQTQAKAAVALSELDDGSLSEILRATAWWLVTAKQDLNDPTLRDGLHEDLMEAARRLAD